MNAVYYDATYEFLDRIVIKVIYLHGCNSNGPARTRIFIFSASYHSRVITRASYYFNKTDITALQLLSPVTYRGFDLVYAGRSRYVSKVP